MRAGWKAGFAGGAAILAAVVVIGCGSSNDSPKAKYDTQLKELPAPGSPGGGAPEVKGKGKVAAGSTPGSQ